MPDRYGNMPLLALEFWENPGYIKGRRIGRGPAGTHRSDRIKKVSVESICTDQRQKRLIRDWASGQRAGEMKVSDTKNGKYENT